MLREAKEEAENRAHQEEEFEEARKAHFGAVFDDFNGKQKCFECLFLMAYYTKPFIRFLSKIYIELKI